MQSSINQIKASAGSGKTHTIINILLALLLNEKKSIKDIFSSVLAITFTNAAAADMKSKLISRLKSIALGLEGNANQALIAKRSIDGLIENYNSLNMRTIDSFLLMVLRQNLLETHLPATFDIAFDKAEFFDPLLEELAYSALGNQSANQEKHELSQELLTLLEYYEKMYEALFYNVLQKGFLGTKKIRQALYEALNLMATLSLDERNLLSSAKEVHNKYSEAFEQFDFYLNTLDAFLEERKTKVAKGKDITFAPYRKAVQEFRLQRKLPSFFRADAESLFYAILNKKEAARLLEPENKIDYAKIIELIEKIAFFYQRTWLLYNALKYTAVTDFTKLILELQDFEEYSKEKLLSDRISEILLKSINEEGLFPTMLSHMPFALDFLLIDEFQDTNSKQWEVISHFVREILSQGGNFTYVGDVKQAIYAWRGGEAALFEDILLDFDYPKNFKTLDTNWRSAKNVIAFNNAVFSQLKDKEYAIELLDKIFKNQHEAVKYAPELQKIYADVEQEVSEKWLQKNHGKAALYPLPSMQKNEDLYILLKEQILDIIRKGRDQYQYKDMAILLRDNIMCAQVAQWLTEANIPVITEGSLEITSNFVIGQILSLIDFLADDDNSLALWHFIHFEGLFSESIQGLNLKLLTVYDALSAKKEGVTLFSYLKVYSPQFADLLEEWKEDSQKLNLYDLLCKIFEQTELFIRMPQQSGFFSRFLEIVFQASTRNITSIRDFLHYWKSEGYKEKIPMPENVDAVRIQTIHKSKGAEYKFVLLWNEKKQRALDELKHYNLGELSFFAPHSIYHTDYGNDLKIQSVETLNLFYVAFTRAKEELHILYKKGKTSKTISQMLVENVQEMCTYNELEKNYLFGDYNAQAIEKSAENLISGNSVKEKRDRVQSYMALKQKKFTLNFQELQERNLTLTPLKRGTLIHLFFEKYFNLAKSVDADERKIAANILADKNLLAEDKESLCIEIIDIFSWIKTLPDFELWQKNSLSEQSILSERKELLRCDLFVITHEKIIVIDFKTGHEDQKNKTQIIQYLKVLSGIENLKNKEIEGKIIYLDLRKVIECGASDE